MTGGFLLLLVPESLLSWPPGPIAITYARCEDGWSHDPDADTGSHSASDEPRELKSVAEATLTAT
jgi:hypothetical protein